MLDCLINAETAKDRDAVANVHRLAFGRDDEGRLVERLRDSGLTEISLVARLGLQIVGHILFSRLPIVTPGGVTTALALVPLAVLPDLQRQGIGSQLVRSGLEECRSAGYRVVVVLGHPEFYPRFGFSAKLAAPLESPFSGDAFMAAELVPRALSGLRGVVQYPPPFFDV